jgi:hypothetical protein
VRQQRVVRRPAMRRRGRATSSAPLNANLRPKMTRGARGLMFPYLAMASALIASSTSAFAHNSSRQYAAVVCTSEATGPWSLKARGTLTRTKARDGLIYRFDVGEQSYTWRFVNSPEGNTTAMGPGLLMGRLVPLPKQPEQSPLPRGPINVAESPSDPNSRRQNLSATGEIREYAGTNVLSLTMGSQCPARIPKLPPNDTVDPDTRKSGARGSP